ncbi:MAG: hypothetical protein V1739_01185 [Candidatus Omnitrophota bacterium]
MYKKTKTLIFIIVGITLISIISDLFDKATYQCIIVNFQQIWRGYIDFMFLFMSFYNLLVFAINIIYGISCVFVLMLKDKARKVFLLCTAIALISELLIAVYLTAFQPQAAHRVYYSSILGKAVSKGSFLIVEIAVSVYYLFIIYFFTRAKVKEQFKKKKKDNGSELKIQN